MIDTEFAAAPDFWKAVGVDITKLPYINLVTLEEIFGHIEHYIGVVRKVNNGRILTVIVDSLAQASCEVEMESDHGKDGYNTGKSIIVSKALRKMTGLIAKQKVLLIFTNQLRFNMKSAAFGDPYIEPTGKALAFGSSVRIRLSNTGQIKKGDVIIGNKCKAVVVKNRMGPPRRSANFTILYDSGVQDLQSWLDFLKENQFITGTSSKWTFKLNSGDYKLSTQEFVDKINTTPSFKDEVYNIICEKQIMKYRNPNEKIEEEGVETDDVTDEENEVVNVEENVKDE